MARWILIGLCIGTVISASIPFIKAQKMDDNDDPSNVMISEMKDAPLRYVRGVYEVPQPPNELPVIYDTYFPVIFEFNLPKWDPASMKIQFWKDHNNCTESEKFSDGYPCPIMHHMNTLIANFAGNMTLWKNLFLDDPLPSDEHSSRVLLEDNPDLDLPLVFSRNSSLILDQEYYCSKIVPHFTNFQTSRDRVDEYYKLLDKCENDLVPVVVNMSESTVSLESMYHTTFSSFVSDYWDRLPSMISKQAVTVSVWSSLESTLLLHQYMETQKWTNAINSCQQSQIPWTLIDHDAITSAIQSHTLFDSHQLAIPLTEMSKYFKLPLTDCVFVEKDTLVVRVLIPVRFHAKEEEDLANKEIKSKSAYKIIKFEPIVFHEDGEFCWIDGIRNKRFVTDSAHEGNLYVTECNSGEGEQKLCHIPINHYSSHDAADPCAQALYTDSEQEIVESCVIKCLPVDKRHFNFKYFNFAHTFDDNFIYSVADDELAVKIKCEGKKPFKIGRLNYAAWNLTLPCGCEITGGGPTIHFEIASPCHDNFIVEKIRPYHWRNISKKGNKTVTSSAQAASSSGGFRFNSARTEDEFVELLDQRYGAYTLHYVTLWVIILVLSVTVGLLSYFVVQLREWRKHELFRESRLIYSNVDNREDFQMEGPAAQVSRY